MITNSYDEAIERRLPIYAEVASWVPETASRLAKDAEEYNRNHPYEFGYECWTPEFGISFVRVHNLTHI